MVLQLHDQEQGNLVWKRAKIPNRRLCSMEMSMPLLMTVPKDANKPEGGLVVAGVARRREETSMLETYAWGNCKTRGPGQLKDRSPLCAQGGIASSPSGPGSTAATRSRGPIT